MGYSLTLLRGSRKGNTLDSLKPFSIRDNCRSLRHIQFCVYIQWLFGHGAKHILIWWLLSSSACELNRIRNILLALGSIVQFESGYFQGGKVCIKGVSFGRLSLNSSNTSNS